MLVLWALVLQEVLLSYGTEAATMVISDADRPMHHQHTQMVRHTLKPPRTCQAFRDITTSTKCHITSTTMAVPTAMAAMVVQTVSLSLEMYRRGGIPGLKGRRRCLRPREGSPRTSDPALFTLSSSVTFLRSMRGHRLSCRGLRRHFMMSLRVWEKDKQTCCIALQLSLLSDQGNVRSSHHWSLSYQSPRISLSQEANTALDYYVCT